MFLTVIKCPCSRRKQGETIIFLEGSRKFHARVRSSRLQNQFKKLVIPVADSPRETAITLGVASILAVGPLADMPEYIAEFPASAPSRAWNRAGNALKSQSDVIGNQFMIILAAFIIARVEELLIVAEFFWLG